MSTTNRTRARRLPGRQFWLTGVFAWTLLAAVSIPMCALAQQDFSIDPASPETANFSPADIISSDGTTVFIDHSTLGLNANANINSFSYGWDEIEPLGPLFYVTIEYSVDRNTVGLQGGIGPGAGIIWANSQAGNGAAGDKYYLKARQFPLPVGMFPITRGMLSDAPMHNLTPTGAGPIQSDIDGMSFRAGGPVKTVYYTVDSGGPPWNYPSDIFRVDIDPATGAGSAPVVWASAAQLGLSPTDVIDALAISNRDGGDLDQDVLIYVSLAGQTPENVQLIWPQPGQVIFKAGILNLTNGATEELNAMTGVDPGPLTKDGDKLPDGESGGEAMLAQSGVLESLFCSENLHLDSGGAGCKRAACNWGKCMDDRITSLITNPEVPAPSCLSEKQTICSECVGLELKMCSTD